MTILSSLEATKNQDRVLIIADNSDFSHMLRMVLYREHWDVKISANAESAILDINMFSPEIILYFETKNCDESLDFLVRLRSQGAKSLVLFVIEGKSDETNTSGLTVGGDEILYAPYSFEDICTNIRKLLQRSRPGTAKTQMQAGDIVLDEESHEVFSAKRYVHLTKKEFDLLRYLMRNSNRVLSKQEILDNVWSLGSTSKSSVVELYVSYLRQKLDTAHDVIKTVRGFGYILKK